MPIFAPKWIFSRFATWIFDGVRILLVGQCILHSDNGAEFSYQLLFFTLADKWPTTKIVHGKPRYLESQGP